MSSQWRPRRFHVQLAMEKCEMKLLMYVMERSEVEVERKSSEIRLEGITPMVRANGIHAKRLFRRGNWNLTVRRL